MSDVIEKEEDSRTLELRIKKQFVKEHIPIFANLIKVDREKLRLYAIELPVKTNKDGTKKADIILEIVEDGDLFNKNNKLLVLEFKSKKVDYQSAVAQVLRYSDVLRKQLWRKKRVTPFVVSTGYSEAEIKLIVEDINVQTTSCSIYWVL